MKSAKSDPKVYIVVGVLLVLAVLLRIVFLDSDAYPRLSWSTGLLTDEGFYLHNARNLILFGTERTDEFNNALMMPTLHWVQVWVFRAFGVGVVQARMISVVASLLALIFFYDAMRIASNRRVASVAALFLGLDHISLLYNRLALMDTPATLPLIIAFWAFVRSQKCAGNRLFSSSYYLSLCGLFMIVAYATRGLCALFVPVPFLALMGNGTERGRKFRMWGALASGLLVAALIYLVGWYLPHRAELTHMNRHYTTVQLLPHSMGQFFQNVQLGLLGDARGMFAYLLRHSPVQFVFAVFGLAFFWIRQWQARYAEFQPDDLALSDVRRVEKYLNLWLLFAWVALLCVNYNPSRYYVLFYPAMAGLAALSVEYWTQRWNVLRSHPKTLDGVAGIVGYHVLASFLPHIFPAPKYAMMWLCLLLAVSGAAWGVRTLTAHPKRANFSGRSVMTSVLCLWAVLNAYWLTDWLTHLTYRQKETDQLLAKSLPPDSVLIGALAPGLCINNHFRVVAMIDGLCNYDHPVERYAGSSRYIITLDEAWRERWWDKHYPDSMTRNHRIMTFRGVLRPHFVIGVYAVPADFGTTQHSF